MEKLKSFWPKHFEGIDGRATAGESGISPPQHGILPGNNEVISCCLWTACIDYFLLATPATRARPTPKRAMVVGSGAGVA